MAWLYNSLFAIFLLTSCIGILSTIIMFVLVYKNSDKAISFSLIQDLGKSAILTLLSFYLSIDFVKKYSTEVVSDANHPLAGQKLIFELELIGLE